VRKLRLAAVLAAALACVCLCCSQALAGTLTLTVLPGVNFPTKQFVLTSSAPLAIPLKQIEVSENGQPVHLGSVQPASAVGRSHFATMLLIDTSGSMNGAPLQAALSAARGFIAARNAEEPVGIIFFSSTPVVASGLTADGAQLTAALGTTPPLGSGTHIFDVASQALRMLRNASITAGTLIVISDGADSGSHLSQQTVASQALDQGVHIYTIGVKDASFDGSTLSSLASSTGGSYVQVGSQGLPPLLSQLGQQVSNQYVIRYQSTAALGSVATVAATVPGSGSAQAEYQAPTTPNLPTKFAASSSSSFFTSGAGAMTVSIIGAMLVGLGVLAVTRRRAEVGSRVGGFVMPAPPSARQKQQTLVERALGDRTRGRGTSREWLAGVLEELDIARITIPPGQLLLFTLLGSVLVGWALVLSTGSAVGALPALMVPFLTYVLIRSKADRERRAFEEQLPDNLQVVASAMRAGQTFPGALGVVVADAPEPSRRELRGALTDEQLGFPLADALGKVATRMRSIDFEHVAFVASLQRETGGNTAEVIDLVTETIRQRLEIRRLVRALTAQGRLAGVILTVLPPSLLILISTIAPTYEHPLFHTGAGQIALVAASIMVIAAAVIINKIVTVEV
jgi:tight adherence protein B